MLTFNLQIFEDQLLNSDDLLNFLTSTTEEVELSTQGEGPSLHQCGLIKLLEENNIDLSRIKVRTPNFYEQLPVERIYNRYKFSYWFRSVHQAVARYKFEHIPGPHRRIGCFIGRKNLDRLAILYWISRRYKCFLSSLREDQIYYEQRPDLEQWVDNKYSFESWIREFNIPSIDNYSVQDQYTTKDMFQENSDFLRVQTNMLNYYNQFDVELVCETFVRGQTYFPTEKTTRPLAGGKPMLVYGPKNFLANLREQGFKTWSDIWDESYDEYEGIERWDRMKPIINQITAWGDWEWTPIIKQANQIAEYNKTYFQEEVINDY